MNTRKIFATAAILPMLGAVSFAQNNQAAIGYEFINIRRDASMSSPVEVVLKKFDKVDILEKNNGWTKVKTKTGIVGWVGSQALISVKDAEEINYKQGNDNITVEKKEKIDKFVKSSKNLMQVSNDRLNVRSGPGTNYKIIDVLNEGQKVDVITESVSWTKIRTADGKEGYVSTRYLSEINQAKSGQKAVMRVTSRILNIRAEKSISSDILSTVKHGTELTQIDSDDSWSKIQYDGKTGYVPTYFLEFIKLVDEKPAEPEITEVETGDVLNKTPGSINYITLDYSLSDHVNKQLSIIRPDTGIVDDLLDKVLGNDSLRDDLEYSMNPDNFKDSKAGMMQFARLDEYKDIITAQELNSYLNTYCKPGNVFYNQGQSFINAAKKNNINVLYLVAHSMIETGYGKSKLANGTVVNGTTVYNFFGIGAYDGSANTSGAQAAYKNGWTSVEKTIDGSAEWIARGYIHNSKYNQNTLYKMKFNYNHPYHQYATDLNWPKMIGIKMANILGYSSTGDLNSYEVPSYQ